RLRKLGVMLAPSTSYGRTSILAPTKTSAAKRTVRANSDMPRRITRGGAGGGGAGRGSVSGSDPENSRRSVASVAPSQPASDSCPRSHGKLDSLLTCRAYHERPTPRTGTPTGRGAESPSGGS